MCAQYDAKLCNLLENYNKCFIVHADNVGSKQFQDIRRVWLWLCSSFYMLTNTLCARLCCFALLTVLQKLCRVRPGGVLPFWVA